MATKSTSGKAGAGNSSGNGSSVVSRDFSARLGKLTGATKALKAPAQDVMQMALGAGVDLGPMGTLRWVPVELIENSPFQTRENISDEHIQSLIESLDGRGLIEIPPARYSKATAAESANGAQARVEIGAGHCRTEAVRQGANAGSQLPEPERFAGKMLFLIKERDDLEMAAIGVDENVVRENPNPIELARGYRNLKRVLEGEGLPGDATWDVIAQRAQVSTRRVHQLVKLFELPEQARKRIAEGTWNEKHGRAVLGAQPEHRELLMRQIIREDLSGNAAVARAGQLVKTHPTEAQKKLLEVAGEAIRAEAKRKSAQAGGKSAARLKKAGEEETEQLTGESTEANVTTTTSPAGVSIGRRVAGATPTENHLRIALESLNIAVVALELSSALQKGDWTKKLLDIGDEIKEAARNESGEFTTET